MIVWHRQFNPQAETDRPKWIILAESGSRSKPTGPGKPTYNTFIEYFNDSFRDEYPNANWFLSLEDVRGKMEAGNLIFCQVRSLKNPQ
jgi:hypothetical protein